MQQKTVVMVKTKLNEDAKEATITALTFNWAGVTAEMLQAPASQTLTINKQGEWRRKKAIPQTEEVMVKDMILRMGSRSITPTVEGVAAAVTTLSPADRAALIKKLQEDEKAAAKQANKGGSKSAPKGDGDKDRPQA